MNAKNNGRRQCTDAVSQASSALTHRQGNSQAPLQSRRQGITAQKSPTPTRGYQKIAAAAQALGINFRGQIVLDIGSSSGGFTRFALEQGATQVIAVEKGTQQMAAPLRFDPRVELHEKTDIFTFIPARLPDLILADVSFISLTKVLMYAKLHLSRPHTRFFVMLKPQFEASPAQLTSGVVKNSKTRRTILKTFELWLKSHGFVILAKVDNRLPGRSGNLERFYHLSLE